MLRHVCGRTRNSLRLESAVTGRRAFAQKNVVTSVYVCDMDPELRAAVLELEGPENAGYY